MALAIQSIMMIDFGNYYEWDNFGIWIRDNSQGSSGYLYTGEYIRDVVEFRKPMDQSLIADVFRAAGKDWSSYKNFRDNFFSRISAYAF